MDSAFAIVIIVLPVVILAVILADILDQRRHAKAMREIEAQRREVELMIEHALRPGKSSTAEKDE